MNKNKVLFYASLLSVVASIAIFQSDPISGIFVGLWAPTLMTLSNRYQ
jgi:alpha-acetolactate decarboxylase